MTRKEAEQAISEKVAELWDIYQEYNPGGYGIGLYVTKDLIHIYNEYWANDKDKPLTASIKRGGAAYDEMPEVWDSDTINSNEG